MLEKLRFNLWDGEQMVATLIEKWKLRNCKTEKQYETSLYNYLHENLTELQITKQYARGRIRADIAVEEKVIIELKNNLDATGKYQRLVGQLVTYKDWGGSVFIVLCGTTDRNLLKELKSHIEDSNGGELFEERFRIFETTCDSDET